MLNGLGVERLKPGAKDKQIPDSDGLYLLMRATGRKTWIVRVWMNGKEKRITLGDYPAITLLDERRGMLQRYADFLDSLKNGSD